MGGGRIGYCLTVTYIVRGAGEEKQRRNYITATSIRSVLYVGHIKKAKGENIIGHIIWICARIEMNIICRVGYNGNEKAI